MVNTKTTPRMEGHRCPMCNVRIANESEWEKHVVECGKKRRQKKFECADCDYATNKKSDMGRHRRTRHNEIVSVTADSGTDDWEQLDPGNMSDVVGSTPQQPLVDILCELPETDRGIVIFSSWQIISRNGRRRLLYRIWRQKLSPAQSWSK